MRFWILFGALTCFGVPGNAAEIRASAGETGRYRLRSPTRAREVSSREVPTAMPLGPAERERLRALARLANEGDGDAADIVDGSILLVQTRFLEDVPGCGFPAGCAGPCNVVVILWDENVVNPLGVNLFFNGNLITNVDGLAEDELPGTNGINLLGAPAGLHEVLIEDANTLDSEQCEILVVDAKPFGEPENVRAEDAGDDASGFCKLFARWDNFGVRPGGYLLDLDDNAYGGIFPAAVNDVLIEPDLVPEGGNLQTGTQHTLAVQALRFQSGCAAYLGCRILGDASPSCDDVVPCDGPGALRACQNSYGATSEIAVTWVSSEADYALGIAGFVDDLDNAIGVLPGTTEAAIFGGIVPGLHTFGVEGNCGDGIPVPPVATVAFDVLESSPYPDPIDGDPACEFDEDLGEIAVSWDYAARELPAYVVIAVRFVDDASGEEVTIGLGSLPGDATAVDIAGATGEETVVLRFVRFIDGECYSSPEETCSIAAEEFFVRGGCGNPDTLDPQITNAIAIFGFLFLGTTTPQCLEACNVDGQGPINLSDGIYLLNFLFLGGSPPPGYDGTSPTCEAIGPEIDCATPSTVCPLAVAGF